LNQVIRIGFKGILWLITKKNCKLAAILIYRVIGIRDFLWRFVVLNLNANSDLASSKKEKNCAG